MTPYVGPETNDWDVTVLAFSALKRSTTSSRRCLFGSARRFDARQFTEVNVGSCDAPNGSRGKVMVAEFGSLGPPAGSTARNTYVRYVGAPLTLCTYALV